MGRPGGELSLVSGMGGGEHSGSRCDALLGQPVMHVKRGQQSKARMMVLGVVPGEEDMTVRPSVLHRAEPRGKRRAVFQRLELRNDLNDYPVLTPLPPRD